MSASIDIDGSQGEGGGQILRSSLALSLLTGKAFHLRNIRAGRAKPGLQPQHLMSVRAAATVGQAHTVGASLGSSALIFEPGQVRAGNYPFAIGTAGATGLVLHTIYLPLALRGDKPSQLTISGGTHVTHSPCHHFNDITWRAYLAHLGLNIGLTMERPGFYPRGGGSILAAIAPTPVLQGQALDVRPATKITGFSAVAGLPQEIAERQARRAAKRLRDLKLPATIREETWIGGPGTVLGLVLDTQPAPTFFFGLGARGKRAEAVADEAVEQVAKFLQANQAGVDAHSADQLVLPLALAQGASRYPVAEVTQHLLTNVAIVRRFVEREIICEGAEGGPGVVRVSRAS